MRMAYSCSFSALLVFCLAGGQAQQRRLSFSCEQMGLGAVCDTLVQKYGIPLVYVDSDVQGESVTMRCDECSVEDFLSRMLQSTHLSWRRTQGQYLLLRRAETRQPTRATISGTVRDSVTGESLAGANVMLFPDSAGMVSTPWTRVCPSNSYGFYSLRRVPCGSFRVVARLVGYRPATVRCTITDSASLQVDPLMVQEQIAMPGVTIERQRSVFSSAEGVSHGVFIRSTPADQHQYLLDGARIYNPSHFGGILSAFSAEALNDIQTNPGGIPPYYGGRIGGILDLSMREGTMERLGGSVGTGSLGSHLFLEGPAADNITFMVSGRRGYPDLLLPRIRQSGVPNTLRSSELIAKLSHRLSRSDRLFLSGYIGRDSYSNAIRSGGMGVDNNLSWGNASANLRWIGIASPSLFLLAAVGYTRYDFTVTHDLNGDPFLGFTRFASDYRVEDVSVRAHAEHYYDEEHTVRGGVEAVHHRMTGGIDQYTSQLAQVSLRDFSSWEVSIYFQDQWRLLPGVAAEIGARATTFTGEKGAFSAVDPRFSLLAFMDNGWRLVTSMTAINQFVHPYRNSGLFLFYPTIFWYPSTDRVRPSHAVQVSLGTVKEFAGDAFVCSAESYYRVTHNLHEFGFDTSLAPTRDLDDVILYGKGEVYGVELSLQKRTGSLTGSVSYSFSRATNEFAEINEGRPYHPRFDRRHEVQVALLYVLNDHWAFGGTGVLATDQSPSIAPRIIREIGISPAEAIDLNGSRLPGFQRIELRVLHNFEWWGWPLQATLRLLNGYGLLDPFAWELRNDPDVRLKWRATLDDAGLFPRYPTLGLSVRF
jgi:hypothetical protein